MMRNGVRYPNLRQQLQRLPDAVVHRGIRRQLPDRPRGFLVVIAERQQRVDNVGRGARGRSGRCQHHGDFELVFQFQQQAFGGDEAVARLLRHLLRLLEHAGKLGGQVELPGPAALDPRLLVEVGLDRRQGAGRIAARRLGRLTGAGLLAEAQKLGAQAKQFQVPSNKATPLPPEAPKFADMKLIDYDQAKYGEYSRRPYIDIVIPSLTDPSVAPPGKHVMSCFVQYAPYDLKEGRWDDCRDAFGDAVIDAIAEFAPNIKDIIRHRQVLTPLDIERTFGLSEGNIFQGELSLEQLFFLRPAPGWAGYRTPIRKLFMCGSATHPGGGIMGAPGLNAARVILGQ